MMTSWSTEIACYPDDNPGFCPRCQRPHIRRFWGSADLQPDRATAGVPCECGHCGAGWAEVWRLAGIDTRIQGVG
jgi:rhodanese-related sulfurtransferase